VLRLLIVDNYDSFTWNLAHAAAALTGELPAIVHNDEADWRTIEALRFDAIVISPGPGHPAVARDFGVSADVIRHARTPVLGVCLGHQGIVLEFGGEVRRVQPTHGEVGTIEHDALDPMFHGIPRRFDAVRYHSLAACDPLPRALKKTAWAADGTVMALRHMSRPIWGVQFHPESLLTEYGGALLANFLRLAHA
jgi:para-aminobenzoate synthetase